MEPSEFIMGVADKDPFTPKDAAPKRTASTKKSSPTVVSVDKLVEALGDFYRAMGTLVAYKNEFDGHHIALSADVLAESWRDVLTNDPKMRKFINKLVQGGSWSGVVMAHFMVALPIMQNHRGALDHLIKRRNAQETSETLS